MFFRRKSAPAPKKLSPADDETSIGNLLLKMHAVTRAQLAEAVSRKLTHDDMLLGALLKDLGYCSDEDVAAALTMQAKLRSGDAGSVALDVMELRLENFDAAEDRLAVAIAEAREQRRRQGEESGLWILPLSPAKAG